MPFVLEKFAVKLEQDRCFAQIVMEDRVFNKGWCIFACLHKYQDNYK